jgi:hypothetical protein
MQLSPFFISLVISLSACSVAAAPNVVIDSNVLKREVESKLELVVRMSAMPDRSSIQPRLIPIVQTIGGASASAKARVSQST